MVTPRYVIASRPVVGRRNRILLLASFFLFGLSGGAALAGNTGSSFLLWMRTVSFDRVSIVSLCFSLLLPFLFSAFAVFFFHPRVLFFACFFKGFSFGFCCAGLLHLFSPAGWLVCWLILFSDLAVLPILWWFWIRLTRNQLRKCLADASICAALVFLIASIDRCFISLFAAFLLEI